MFNPNHILFIRNSSWVFYIFSFSLFLPFTFAIQWNFRAYVDCITTVLTILSPKKKMFTSAHFVLILISFFSLTLLYTLLISVVIFSSIQSNTYAGMCMFSVCMFVWFCICVRYSTCVDEITIKDKRKGNVLCVCHTLHWVSSKSYWFWDTFWELYNIHVN